MEEKVDKTITCRDCGGSFVFSVSEQQFFAASNFTDPQRCRPCRVIKRARFAEEGRAFDSRVGGGWHR